MENTITLTINGTDISLSEKDSQALLHKYLPNLCGKPEIGQTYWFVGYAGGIESYVWGNDDIDNDNYNHGNCYTNKAMAEQVVLHQQLTNLLRQYCENNGGDSGDWDDNGHTIHYSITYDFQENKYVVNLNSCLKHFGVIYFRSKDVALAAIEEVIYPFMKEHPNFKP